MPCPDPGIYYDIPADDYFAWEAVSNSKLSLMNRSPMHYKHGFGESTPAMRLGSLVHSGVLEPLSIAKRYVFMPDYSNHPENTTANGDRSFSGATKFVKQMQETFRRMHHNKEIVSEPEYDMMVGMATALVSNQAAKNLLREGVAEVSLVWVDPMSGLTCKSRIDWLDRESGRFCDLKTTMDAGEFERSIVKYGYHRQMAFYGRGLEANGINAEPWILATEKSAPYGCRTAPMDVVSISYGHKELDVLLQRVLDCQQSGQWPGYANPESWSCPDWYTRQQNPAPEDRGTLGDWFESALETAGGVN